MSSPTTRRRALALGVVGVAVAGCRALLGIDDAPATTRDGGGDDAGDESAAPDAGPRFCATKLETELLCADFDDQNPIEQGWDNLKNGTSDFGVSGKGSTITADTTVFFSGFRAASLHLPPLLTSDDHGTAYLVKNLPTTPQQLQIDVQLRVVTEQYPKPSGGKVVLLFVSYFPNGSLNVVRDGTGTALWVALGTPPVSTVYPFKGSDLVPGKWSKLQLVVDNRPIYDGGTGDIEVLLDGLPVANTAAPPDFQMQSSQEIDIGPLAKGSLGDFTMNVDDVRILLPK